MSTYCNEGVFYDSNVILFLIFVLEAYVVGTHFNCFDFFFMKAYVVGNSFELPRQIEDFQMSTNNNVL